MPKQSVKDDRVNTMIRVPRDLHKQMQAQARERDVSVNKVFQFAAEHWLDCEKANP